MKALLCEPLADAWLHLEFIIYKPRNRGGGRFLITNDTAIAIGADVQVPVEHVVTALVRGAKREKESLMRHVRATAMVLRKLYFGGWQSILSNLNPGRTCFQSAEGKADPMKFYHKCDLNFSFSVVECHSKTLRVTCAAPPIQHPSTILTLPVVLNHDPPSFPEDDIIPASHNDMSLKKQQSKRPHNDFYKVLKFSFVYSGSARQEDIVAPSVIHSHWI